MSAPAELPTSQSLRWCLALGMLLLLVCVTHLPGVDVNGWHRRPHMDLGYHAAGYAVATGLLIGLRVIGRNRLQRVLLPALLLAIGAILDEWTQPLFGRTCAVLDLASDWVGIATVAAGGLVVLHFRTPTARTGAACQSYSASALHQDS